MIDVVLYTISDFERWLKNVQAQLDSKQSSRFFSSHVWLRAHVDEVITKKLIPAKKQLMELKEHTNDSPLEVNLNASIKYCDVLLHLMGDIMQAHKDNYSPHDIQLKWQQALPPLYQNVNHLRNRLTIAKNMQKHLDTEEEDWLRP